jgi:ribosomal protein S18 acetylase RimI-like enzyme
MTTTDKLKGLEMKQAASASEILQARELFLEYAQSLGFSLCFQSFDQELAQLPGDYAPPDGCLLLATYQGQLAGCVALHALVAPASSPAVTDVRQKHVRKKPCEMKRLYLRSAFRGKRIGRALAERVIHEARQIGYTHMRLDTIATTMADAVALYRTLGFQEIAPYRENPIATALYMELKL